jgi:hypothetical protein
VKHDWIILWPLTVFACVVLWVMAITYPGPHLGNHVTLYAVAVLLTALGAWAIRCDVKDMRR